MSDFRKWLCEPITRPRWWFAKEALYVLVAVVGAWVICS